MCLLINPIHFLSSRPILLCAALQAAHPDQQKLFNFAGCNYAGVRLIIPAGIIDIIFSVSLTNIHSIYQPTGVALLII